MDNKFCVYVHKDELGNIRYVGSGTIQRANLLTSKSFRGKNYCEFSKSNTLIPEIIYHSLSKKSSIELEVELYNKLKPSGLLLNVKKPNSGFVQIPENINDVLFYNVESPSRLSWKSKGGAGNKVHYYGDTAGCTDKYGYYVVRVKDKLYKAHRLIYSLFYSDIDISELVIDHIDGDKTNNNIENLRAVSQSINARNITKRKRKHDLPTGVLWFEKRKGFQAYVKNPLQQHSNGANKDIQKSFSVSNFNSKEDALQAAILWRNSKLEEINSLLDLGYSERHGT